MNRKTTAALLVLALVAFANLATPRPGQAASNPIVLENQQQGSSAWQLGSLIADDVGGQIKGYASATSVSQNQSITLYVTVNPAQTYTIDFYRVGWYGGLGGRFLLHVGPLAGTHQAACLPDLSTGLIDCNWTPSYVLSVPASWTSGAYLAILTNAVGYQNDVIFVVRDGRPAPILYQQSVTTYQAYNNYPDDHATGKSLYPYNSYGAPTVGNDARAVKVSFDRPYTADGSGDFFLWEVDFIRWLERSGYDVTYSTDVDTHANGAELKNHKAFLSIGHDEYWSKEMYDAAQSARDAGVNLAFFSGNAVYWQVRFEPSSRGLANRVMVCYKDATIDPVQGPTTTVNWRSAPVNRPEQELMGIQYTAKVDWGKNVPYVVTNSSSWIYAGTGFKDGDTVPGIVGDEMDRYMPDYPAPAWTTETLLSNSPLVDFTGRPDYANSSIYQAPSQAWVFAGGTLSWAWGLDNYNSSFVDSRIQRTTANVLNAFLYGAPTSTVRDLKVTAPTTVTAGQPFNVSVTAEDAQGSPVTTYTGTVHFSTSDGSSGVVLPPDSTLTNGQGTFAVTLAQAGAQTLTVSDAANSLSTTLPVQVTAAGAASLQLVVPGSVAANQPFNVTVSLTDQFGNPAIGYTGTVTFSSSDMLAQLPGDYTFTSADAATRTFSVTLVTPPSQTITVTDVANGNLSATSPPIAVTVSLPSTPLG